MMVHFFVVLEFSRVVSSSALPKLCQSCKEVLHSTLSMYHIVPCTHIHSHVGHLLLTNNCMQKEEEGWEKEREERGGRRGRGRRGEGGEGREERGGRRGGRRGEGGGEGDEERGEENW